MIDNGFPAYTTSAGWLGYSDEKITRVNIDTFEISKIGITSKMFTAELVVVHNQCHYSRKYAYKHTSFTKFKIIFVLIITCPNITPQCLFQLCKEALAEGFTRFKVKVGLNQDDDLRRVALVRKEIGDDNVLVSSTANDVFLIKCTLSI